LIFKEDDIYLYRDAIYDMNVGSGAGINAIRASTGICSRKNS
jgi:hypothetical protein